MPTKSTTKPEARSKISPSALVNNPDLERFFGNCCDDTRRKIFAQIGLPRRKKRPWAEVWSVLGLATEQAEELWNDLTLGSRRNNILWDATRVAEEAGLAATTINSYCHKGQFPEDFPEPLINLGRKTRLWLPLEVRAYIAPSIYGDRARLIQRISKVSAPPKKAATVRYTGSMQPLPPKDPNAE
jgi:hypothetical protein